MAKYRKKSVVVEAMQFTADTEWDDLRQFVTASGFRRHATDADGGGWSCLIIPTLEGDMMASEGDWIIKGVKGEFYPCKPDVFEATYEAVEDEAEGE